MIKRLRYKFILIATAALLIVQLYVTGITSIIAQTYTVSRINRLMNILIENSGRIPEERISGELPEMREETPYETRYFSVKINKDGKAEIADISHVAAIEEQEAINLGLYAWLQKQKRGLFDTGDSIYYYAAVKPGSKLHITANPIRNILHFIRKVDTSNSVDISGSGIEGEDELIIFLDCTQRMELVETVRNLSFMIGGMSFLLFFAIIWFFSKKAIRPVVQNMEAQEQFITNAGHELKTPLTIISANTEVIELTHGKSEWTESIKNQVHRLSELVNSLIMLAKIRENRKPELQDMNLSGTVEETAEAFRPVIENQKKTLNKEVAEDIHIVSNAALSRELVTILMDNAAKYCDEGGEVIVKLALSGKNAFLTVENTYREGKDKDFSKFFERFYRDDVSHSSEKKGYGIGLSIAVKIVSTLRGSIKASYEGENIIFGVTLPLKF